MAQYARVRSMNERKTPGLRPDCRRVTYRRWTSDAEADRASTDKPLTKIVDDARPVVLAEIPEGPFEHKARPTTQPAPLEQQKITYWKSTEQIRKVKTALRVKSLKEVGERTFEYFYENECGA